MRLGVLTRGERKKGVKGRSTGEEHTLARGCGRREFGGNPPWTSRGDASSLLTCPFCPWEAEAREDSEGWWYS